MTDRKDTPDIIDRVADEIRSDLLDEDTSQRIAARVWKTLAAKHDAGPPLTGCDDFQAEIPALVAGRLSEARALLVSDHSRECVPCRRALMEARGAAVPVARPRAPRAVSKPLRIALRLAAAVVLAMGGLAAVRTAANVLANRDLRAAVHTVDGSLQLVAGSGRLELAPGSEIRAHQMLRTARDSGALVQMEDGSLIEMNERSELALHASRRGTTIDLVQGSIIVHAADQHGGRLFVATGDCRVAVKGTIFAVNHGLKGSRVSVIEGEVEVRDGSGSELLRPGDQITTDRRLRRVPVEDEIAWSRDAEKHKALLREFTVVRRMVAEAVDHAPPRTSTYLLDLAPADTLLYVAMPNITDGLDEARAAFQQRLATSDVLAQWWQDRVVANGVDSEIDEILDRLQPVGEAIGDEAAVFVPGSVVHQSGTPLFLAKLDDPEGFRELIAATIEEANAEAGDRPIVALIDDPAGDAPPGTGLLVWIGGDFFAVASDIETVRSLAERVENSASREFVDTPLHNRLASAYADGVSWLLGADLAAATVEFSTEIPAEEAEILQRLGLLDASTLVIERHRDGEWYATNAELEFSAPRRGVMAWLAEPAPMGSLSFVSPAAYVAAAAVTMDAAVMFDDIIELVESSEGGALDQLRLFEERVGLDLREDLAATLGGEAAFALDGPMLPVPSWKLIVEVYDPATLFHTIERAVALLNLSLLADGEAPLVLTAADGGGRSYYTLGRSGLDGEVVFAAVDGYLVVAPSRALIEQAISYRAAGATLPASSSFRSLLPDNGYSDCSALVYRDLGSLLDAVPPEMLGDLEFADVLSDGLSKGLVCVFGEQDRITAAATGGSLVGLVSTLGLSGAAHAEPRMTEEVQKTEAVSSL